MYQLTTKANKILSNQFGVIFHSICLERGMLAENIKPRITASLWDNQFD